MAGTPAWPTTTKEPGFGAIGAGEGPGAGVTGAPVQGPLWHPAPQCAVVLPQTVVVSDAFEMLDLSTYIRT